ncbi:aldo/keto reductase [Marinobacterium maritimum]|uniref:Aldo/keto reductase n=1 Tax=Marinobacterium maritimum TaxID=500162 RepID=A0ABP3TF71_9GAMM
MSVKTAPTLTLANGVEMPQLGLGTWPMNDTEAAEAVTTALELGYRMIDTAENYDNERGVGLGIRNASIPRDQVFVTTKFNRKWHSFDGAREACQASLERLGLDYIDLLLIHWPNPDQDRFVEAYLGLLNLLDAGLVRAIGTSNFKPAHLQRLLDLGLTPHLNQIQLDPYHRRDDLIALHRDNNIVTQSWRPLGCGNAMLTDPVITTIAEQHQRTPAQVVLRWAVQQGFATAPKSANPERMAANLSVFDFVLSDEEMASLNRLGRDDPDMLDADTFGH